MARTNNNSGRRRGNVRNFASRGSISRGRFLRTAGITAAGVGAAAVGLGGVAHAANKVLNVPEVYPTIQDAISAATPGDTIVVGPGTYAGAKIHVKVRITGSGESTVINQGVDIGNGTPSGFFIPENIGHAADGTTIENLRIDCNKECALGVYARDADKITVDHLTITKTQQGITARAASGWKITNNKIAGLTSYQADFLHIGILVLGQNDWDPNEVTHNNNVSFNSIDGTNNDVGVPGHRIGIDLNAESAPVMNNHVVRNISHISPVRPYASAALFMEDGTVLANPSNPVTLKNNQFVGLNDLVADFPVLRVPGNWPGIPVPPFPDLADYNTFSPTLQDVTGGDPTHGAWNSLNALKH